MSQSLLSSPQNPQLSLQYLNIGMQALMPQRYVSVSVSLANKPGIMKQENLCVIAHKKYETLKVQNYTEDFKNYIFKMHVQNHNC